jgi:acyl-lipid omega-6 desaturase (Delta-12 desaturase)
MGYTEIVILLSPLNYFNRIYYSSAIPVLLKRVLSLASSGGFSMKPLQVNSKGAEKTWRKIINNYQNPDIRKSIWQLVNTLVPYLVLWVLMIYTIKISYWLVLPLALLAGGLVIRLFIFFHDCGHCSFFKSAKANHWVGSILGVLVFTPFFQWRQSHAVHHATAANLDKRGVGDVWTMTVDEFLEAPRLKRFFYRVYRNPVIMFGMGPLLTFLILHRLPNKKYKKREQNSVHWTNLALAVLIVLMSWLIGFKNYLLIQLPVIWVASTAGVWLFYIQHQFEGVYWERSQEWDFVKAGLEGSSFYQLPKILQWFSGSIGFHHIHHLSPRIPNYLLEKCHRENPLFHVKSVKLWSSMKSLTFRLWDEKKRQLVNFRYLKLYKPEKA